MITGTPPARPRARAPKPLRFRPVDWVRCCEVARVMQVVPDLLRETIKTVTVRQWDRVCTEYEYDAEGEAIPTSGQA
jgi:hypothetical protein